MFMRNRESAFLRTGCFSTASCEVLCEFLIEAVEVKTSVFIVVRRLKITSMPLYETY